MKLRLRPTGSEQENGLVTWIDVRSFPALQDLAKILLVAALPPLPDAFGERMRAGTAATLKRAPSLLVHLLAANRSTKRAVRVSLFLILRLAHSYASAATILFDELDPRAFEGRSYGSKGIFRNETPALLKIHHG